MITNVGYRIHYKTLQSALVVLHNYNKMETVVQFKLTRLVALDLDHGKLHLMLLTESLAVHLQILVHYHSPHYVMQT